MKSNIIGYIVYNQYGVKRLGFGNPAPGEGKEERRVLWLGDESTLFSTRSRARHAILRSLKYAKVHGYVNDVWLTNYIQRVCAEE